jgi:hypothetical protein
MVVSSRSNYLLAICAVALLIAALLRVWDITRVYNVIPAVSVDALTYPVAVLADAPYRSYIGLRASVSELQLAVRACKRPGNCPYHYSQIVTLQEDEGEFHYWGWLANIRLPPGTYQADLFIRYSVNSSLYRTVKHYSWNMTSE